MDLSTLMKLRQAWNTFSANHPKVPPFLKAVKNRPFVPGTEIAVAIRYPDGTEAKTGIRVQPADLELLNSLRELGNRG